MPMNSIPSRGRATQGVYLMRIKKDDLVASISVVDKVQADENDEENPTEEVPTEDTQEQLAV